MRRPPALLSSVVVAVLVAGCGSGDDDDANATTVVASTTPATTATSAVVSTVTETTSRTTTSSAATTTVARVRAEVAYAEAGPYPVGVATVTMGDRRVELWYPGDPGAETGLTSDVYDLREFFPPADLTGVPADAPSTFETDAYRDLRPIDPDAGPFPLVLFSHGAAGYRTQSTFLTTHLASWGYVVASPQHLSRDLTAVVTGVLGQGQDDVADLRQTLDLVDRLSVDHTSVLNGLVDLDRVAVVGHSAGGGAAFRLAADDPIDTYVVLAPAFPDDAAPPARSSLVVAGAADALIDVGAVRARFDGLPEPRSMLVIDEATHVSFMDLCVIGRDVGGILPYALEHGVPVPDLLIRLVADGCDPAYVVAEEAWPIIRHAVTAHLNAALGIDPEPVGLGPGLADAYAPVTAEFVP